MSMAPLPTLAADLARLRSAWDEAGRGPAVPCVTVMQAPEPPAVLRDLLAAYRELGVARVLVDVPTAAAADVLPLLDEVASAL
jgi:hypothetical protein